MTQYDTYGTSDVGGYLDSMLQIGERALSFLEGAPAAQGSQQAFRHDDSYYRTAVPGGSSGNAPRRYVRDGGMSYVLSA